MEWLENLASCLPSPRDDEPPDLRRRIIAELRDHLETAFQRELVRGASAAEARQTVLARFGEPAQLARKLWFDAIKDKIMLQRWMLAAVAAMVLLTAGSLGLAWHTVVQAGHMNQTILEQQRAVTEAMLARLERNDQPSGALGGGNGNWNPLKFKLVLDHAGGPAAEGVKIKLMGAAYSAGQNNQLERTTGADGIADFGLVMPGQFMLAAETSWGNSLDDRNLFGGGILEIDGLLVTVAPGETAIREIVCPAKPPDGAASLSVNWPPELSGRPLWLVCEFTEEPRELAGHLWGRKNAQPQYVVFDPAGKMTNLHLPGFQLPVGSVNLGDERRYYVDEAKPHAGRPGIYRLSPADGVPRQTQSPLRMWLPRAAPCERLTWPVGTYALSRLFVGQDGARPDESPSDEFLNPEFLLAMQLENGELQYPSRRAAAAVIQKRPQQIDPMPKFTLTAGQENDWRVRIPAPLVEALNEPTADESGDEPSSAYLNGYGAPPIYPSYEGLPSPSVAPSYEGLPPPSVAPSYEGLPPPSVAPSVPVPGDVPAAPAVAPAPVRSIED